MSGLLPLLLAVVLAAVHLTAGKLRFLDAVPRSRWLSFAGGISVAYVVVHLLPELAAGGDAIAEAGGVLGAAGESLVWVLALAGLAAFYGLERAAVRSRGRHPEDRTEREVFRIHVGSFAVYNVLIGYLLLHREEGGAGSLLLFALAMALHFVVNDHGLREHHRARYHDRGRWLLSAAVVGGAALGLVVELREAMLLAVTAFVGGGVVLNVLKEELPDERDSRFVPFAVGLAGYTALLLVV